MLDGPLPSTGLPLSGIFVPYAAFFPCAHGLGYLVDGPFYLFFLVQRSINHARPGSSKVANGIILDKTDSCRDAPETQVVSGCLPEPSEAPSNARRGANGEPPVTNPGSRL